MAFNPVIAPKRQLPRGIKSVGIELEGLWKRQLEPEDTEDVGDPWDCAWNTCHWHGGPEGDDRDPDNWERCWRCEDAMDRDSRSPDHQEREHQDLKEDGSVHNVRELRDTHVSGEATSDILYDWDSIKEFVEDRYPAAVSNRCGLHVHIGCTRAQWGFSFDQNYWTHLNHTLLDVGAQCSHQTAAWLKHRITYGRSDSEADYYCVPNREGQTLDDSDRYSAVNYQAFSSHGTLEIRVCPMPQGRRLERPVGQRGTPISALTETAQALALIYGVLLATSEYWTQSRHWKKQAHAVTITEDLNLLPMNTDPPDEHAIFTI